MRLRPDWRLLAHLCLVFGTMVALMFLLGTGLWLWHQKNLAARHNNPLHPTPHGAPSSP